MLSVRRVAALPLSQDRTGTPFAAEPAILKGRRGGTDEFLGRGAAVPQSPRSSGRGGRPLDKGLVQRHADAVIRKSHVAVSEAINRSPVSLLRKKKIASRFRGAPVDKRGHIRVRLADRCQPDGAGRAVLPRQRFFAFFSKKSNTSKTVRGSTR